MVPRYINRIFSEIMALSVTICIQITILNENINNNNNNNNNNNHITLNSPWKVFFTLKNAQKIP